MFPNPFFAAMGATFGPGLNNMGGMPGQGMAGQGMAGQGMAGQGMAGQGIPGFMGAPGMPSGPAGPMVSMQGAHEGPGAGGSSNAGAAGGGGGGGGGARQPVDRNRVCLKFMQTGSCNYGDNCKYAHLTRAEASMMGPSQGSQQGGDRGGRRGGRAGGGGDDEAGGRAKNHGARKTRLCEKFMTQGHCPYGDKCTFAHGHEELRSSAPKDVPMMPQEAPLPVQPPVPGPAPPPEPYPGSTAAAVPAARPAPMASPPAPKPQGGAPSPGPQAPAAAAAAAPKAQEVTFVDKVRALCGVLAIGNASGLAGAKPLALQTAAMSLRNGNALRENPFADSVERYLQAQ